MKTLLLGVVIVHWFTAFALAMPMAKLRDFELVDQYGKTRCYHFPKTMISLVAVSDCKGAGQLAPWIQSIHDRYRERIEIDGVADVSTIPKLSDQASRHFLAVASQNRCLGTAASIRG
jgi:hypothetical protein